VRLNAQLRVGFGVVVVDQKFHLGSASGVWSYLSLVAGINIEGGKTVHPALK
jgi:hypothetical protein